VEERDASAAEDILRYALFKDVVKRQRRKKRKLNHGGASARRDGDGEEDEEASDDEDGENSEEEVPVERMVAPVPATANFKAKEMASAAGIGGAGGPRGISQDPIWGAATMDSQSQEPEDVVRMDLDPTHPVVASDDHSGIRPERCVKNSIFFFFFFFFPFLLGLGEAHQMRKRFFGVSCAAAFLLDFSRLIGIHDNLIFNNPCLLLSQAPAVPQ
jgi:hypothetical protein